MNKYIQCANIQSGITRVAQDFTKDLNTSIIISVKDVWFGKNKMTSEFAFIWFGGSTP